MKVNKNNIYSTFSVPKCSMPEALAKKAAKAAFFNISNPKTAHRLSGIPLRVWQRSFFGYCRAATPPLTCRAS